MAATRERAPARQRRERPRRSSGRRGRWAQGSGHDAARRLRWWFSNGDGHGGAASLAWAHDYRGGHLGVRGGLIDEGDPCWIEVELSFKPRFARRGHRVARRHAPTFLRVVLR